SKIIVFTEEGFEGRNAEFKNDVHNLEEKGFGNVISSIKVIGSAWVAYYDKNFAGEQCILEEGEYPKLGHKFSSLKMVTEDLDNPKIELFEHVNYAGRRVTIRKETNLHDIDFSYIASSHKVKGGVWVLYECPNRQGRQVISFPGDEVPSYLPIDFNDKASYVRPLIPRP
ncbi:putative epidermal differentiation-specific protein-like, partial [Triplophysa rosa]